MASTPPGVIPEKISGSHQHVSAPPGRRGELAFAWASKAVIRRVI